MRIFLSYEDATDDAFKTNTFPYLRKKIPKDHSKIENLYINFGKNLSFSR